MIAIAVNYCTLTLILTFNEHYTLSYAYDIGLSALRGSHEGTHEILLNYNLNKLIGAGLPPKIIYNPRFL